MRTLRSRLDRVCVIACLVPLVLGCTGRPDEPAASWGKDYDATTCTDWVTSMSDAQRHTLASFYVSIFAGSTVAPSAVANDATSRGLMQAITDYCLRPKDAIVAGLGREALLVRFAAAMMLQPTYVAPSAS